MNLLLNILWLLFGGIQMALGWWLAGLLMAVSIVGIPWARACFVVGQLSLWPFGREVVERDVLLGREDIGTGFIGMLGNVVWFLFGGLWLALGHLVTALGLFISIIGIPFGIQHLKLVEISLFPIGKCVAIRGGSYRRAP